MEKRVNQDKAGLSPVIATVLLVLFVIVLASIIFLWARGFLTERIEKFGQPIDRLCSNVEFEVAYADHGAASRHKLEVINRGEIDIFHLDIKMEKGGNAQMNKFSYNVPSGETKTGDILLKMGQYNTEDPEKVTVYPAILGTARGSETNKIYTCLDKGQVIAL